MILNLVNRAGSAIRSDQSRYRRNSLACRCSTCAKDERRQIGLQSLPQRRGYHTDCSKLHANRRCRSPLPLGAVLKEGSECIKRQKSEVSKIHTQMFQTV